MNPTLDRVLSRFLGLLTTAERYGIEHPAVEQCVRQHWPQIMAEYRRELSSCTR